MEGLNPNCTSSSDLITGDISYNNISISQTVLYMSSYLSPKTTLPCILNHPIIHTQTHTKWVMRLMGWLSIQCCFCKWIRRHIKYYLINWNVVIKLIHSFLWIIAKINILQMSIRIWPCSDRLEKCKRGRLKCFLFWICALKSVTNVYLINNTLAIILLKYNFRSALVAKNKYQTILEIQLLNIKGTRELIF